MPTGLAHSFSAPFPLGSHLTPRQGNQPHRRACHGSAPALTCHKVPRVDKAMERLSVGRMASLILLPQASQSDTITTGARQLLRVFIPKALGGRDAHALQPFLYYTKKLRRVFNM
jgi:hypothetical protein